MYQCGETSFLVQILTLEKLQEKSYSFPVSPQLLELCWRRISHGFRWGEYDRCLKTTHYFLLITVFSLGIKCPLNDPSLKDVAARVTLLEIIRNETKKYCSSPKEWFWGNYGLSVSSWLLLPVLFSTEQFYIITFPCRGVLPHHRLASTIFSQSRNRNFVIMSQNYFYIICFSWIPIIVECQWWTQSGKIRNRIIWIKMMLSCLHITGIFI